jgi:hypothetical protein
MDGRRKLAATRGGLRWSGEERRQSEFFKPLGVVFDRLSPRDAAGLARIENASILD